MRLGTGKHAGMGARRDKRQLNAAVRQYLAEQGFKLTALTLVEEGMGQVPLQPPCNSETSLPHLWRGYSERLGALTTSKVLPHL